MRDLDRRLRTLDEALSLEQDLLAWMHSLVSQLPDDSPYREIIERHLPVLEDTIAQIERVSDRNQPDEPR